MLRKASVADQFYPGTRDLLEKAVSELIDNKTKKNDCLGIVSPHAGYIYSGPVAGKVFSGITLKPDYIILGPNHTGYGKPFSIMARGKWQMPLGDIDIDEDLAGLLLKNSKYLEEDDQAHTYEHSIEVQLPFLQYFKKEFKFVPIIISQAQLKLYKELGGEIGKAIKQSKKDVLIIASSDMTHYESAESARKKDKLAISAILKLDSELLMDTILKSDISMCGYAPVIVMIEAAKELGAKEAELIDYKTSGDISGDYSSVVGYAGIIIKK